MPRRLGQQPVAGRGGEAVLGDLAGEDLVVLQPGPHRLHLVDGEGGGARGGDRRVEDAQDHPDEAERRGRPERPAAVAGRDPRDPQQRQHRQDEQRDDEHDRDGDGEVRARGADRVAQRLDADPDVAQVVDGAERPVERGEEPDVEHLHEHDHAQQRAHDHGEHARGRRRAAARLRATTRRSSSGSRTNAPGVSRLGSFGATAAAQTSDQRKDGERDRGAPVRSLIAAAPQPPRALDHRHHQQGECDGEQRLRDGAGQDLRGRDRQHDPLRRRDDLAPAARRQRRAHPRQQPFAGSEHVARGPDREHPPAVLGRDVDAERRDQERVGLAVEARAQRGFRPGAPRHPAIDRVQRQRDGRQRHEQRDRRVVREGVRDQRGDADGERGPGERHPGRRPRVAHRARAPAAMVTERPTPTTQPAVPSPVVSARADSSRSCRAAPWPAPPESVYEVVSTSANLTHGGPRQFAKIGG